MRKRILAVAILTGTLTVGAFAHGAMNYQDSMQYPGNTQGMMANGMQKQGMMNRGMQKQGMMNRGLQSKRMQMNRQQSMGMMGSGMMGHKMGMMKQMSMFSKLNLDSDQRFKISILRDEMKIDMKKLMYNMQKNSSMGSFIKDSGFDKKAFEDKMNNMHKKMLDLKANHMEKVFKILTKEQIDQLKKLMAKQHA